MGLLTAVGALQWVTTGKKYDPQIEKITGRERAKIQDLFSVRGATDLADAPSFGAFVRGLWVDVKAVSRRFLAKATGLGNREQTGLGGDNSDKVLWSASMAAGVARAETPALDPVEVRQECTSFSSVRHLVDYRPEIDPRQPVFFNEAYLGGPIPVPTQVEFDVPGLRVRVLGLKRSEEIDPFLRIRVPEATVQITATAPEIHEVDIGLLPSGIVTLCHDYVDRIAIGQRTLHRLPYMLEPQEEATFDGNRGLALRLRYLLNGKRFEHTVPVGFSFYLGREVPPVPENLAQLALIDAPFLDELALQIRRRVEQREDRPLADTPMDKLALARETYLFLRDFGMHYVMRRYLRTDDATEGEGTRPLDRVKSPMETLLLREGDCADLSTTYLALTHRLGLRSGLVILPWTHGFPVVEIASGPLPESASPELHAAVLSFEGRSFVAPEVTRLDKGLDFVADVLRPAKTAFKGGWSPNYIRVMLEDLPIPAEPVWLESAPIRLISTAQSSTPEKRFEKKQNSDGGN